MSKDRKRKLRSRVPGCLLVLTMFSVVALNVALPRGLAEEQPRLAWAIGCPPKAPAGEWFGHPLEFPKHSVPLDNGRRAIPLLINTGNGGRYHFYVLRTSRTGTSFQVGLFDDVTRDFIQTTPRPEKWREVFFYKRSLPSFGGKEEFWMQAYFSEASRPGVARVFVMLMLYPDDQISYSTYKVYYTADQCVKPSGTPPPPATGCYWNEVTILGQPTAWECVCNGKSADPKRCGPKPR